MVSLGILSLLDESRLKAPSVCEIDEQADLHSPHLSPAMGAP